MNYKNVSKNIVKVLVPLTIGISVITSPITGAFFTSPEGGTIAFSTPCISSMGPGFWTLKVNNPTPIVYLYPSQRMRRNYLPPILGVTTLGLIGAFIDCTTPTIPPVTLTGRMSIFYGTAFGL